MTNLTPFQEKVKAVLIKLQYLCDSTASYKPDVKKGIVYLFKDMYPPLKGEEQLQDVVQYLSENGLEISITFPIYNSDPRESIYTKEYGDPDNVPLGLIKGKNIEEIKEVIQKNINKLNNKNINEINKTNDIILKLDSGLLTLNKNTGWARLNETEIELNPGGKEFKVLLKLITSDDGKATYSDLLGENNVTKPNRRLLTFTIRNLKEKLGILPEKDQTNEDIFNNISGVGYRIK